MLMKCVLSRILGSGLLLVGLIVSACVADPWPEPDEGANRGADETYSDDDGAAGGGADGGVESDASVGNDGTAPAETDRENGETDEGAQVENGTP